MRHIKLATLYPWLELDCPVCGELSDHPVDEVDSLHPWNSQFQQPVCHCGHRYTMMEIKQRATLYG